ncbi:MAG: type I-C CRISPR-associated protein Cas8c/Csd1 [Eubacteriales bacterium]
MDQKEEKKNISSLLLGQMVATLQLMEESVKHHDNPKDNSLTIAEEYFNEVIENPAHALLDMERKLEPLKDRLENIEEKALIRNIHLIMKVKDQCNVTDEHVDEEEFYRGYQSQLKKFMKLD